MEGCKYKCKFPPCKNAYYRRPSWYGKKNKHFFSFPSDPEHRKRWFDAINENCSQPLEYVASKNIYLCEDHFELRFFTSTLKTKFNSKSLTVPTVFSTHDVEKERSESPREFSSDSNIKCKFYTSSFSSEFISSSSNGYDDSSSITIKEEPLH